MFVKLNTNPQKKDVNDCIVRAIAVAENIPWDKVFSKLCDIAMRKACMPNHEEAYGTYLKKLGYIRKNAKQEYNGREPKLYKFVEDHQNIIAIMDVEGHAVPVVNGNYYDTHDHGYKSTYLYWLKE